MATQKTTVQKAIDRLAKELSAEAEQTSGIIRQGDKMVIPERMSLDDAIKALSAYKASQDEVIDHAVEFDCHPFDGMVCFYEAISKTFGNLLGTGKEESFFGMSFRTNGRSYNVPVGVNQTRVVPYGETVIPGLDIRLNVIPNFDSKTTGSLRVIFTCARMYEPVIKQIEALTRAELATHSIFKGKAINSQYQFIDLDGFDEHTLVYSAQVSRAVNANILSPIRDSEAWRRQKSPLKRGVLLSGAYGTGKTLTALHTAKVCEESGWTFINVLPGDNIVTALKFARKYQPAVVFFEDIDSLTDGERDHDLNEILNTVDGVLSKGDEVITILTTNHLERISRAMLRPGRLDSIIQLGGLDEDALMQLVTINLTDRSGKSLLKGSLNGRALYAAAVDYPPAFVKEGVVKAKAYALAEGNDGVTSENVVDALTELRTQYELMNGVQVARRNTLEDAMHEVVMTALESVSSKKAEEENN